MLIQKVTLRWSGLRRDMCNMKTKPPQWKQTGQPPVLREF